MKQLTEVTGLPLQWMQPSARREAYELRAGDDVIATLRFRSMFGSMATAETPMIAGPSSASASGKPV